MPGADRPGLGPVQKPTSQMRSASNKHVTGVGREKKQKKTTVIIREHLFLAPCVRTTGGARRARATTVDRASKRPIQKTKKTKSCHWYHFNHIKIDLHARNRGGRDGSCHLVEWLMGSNGRSGVSKGNTPPVLVFNQDIALFSKYLCLEIEMLKTTGSPLCRTD